VLAAQAVGIEVLSNNPKQRLTIADAIDQFNEDLKLRDRKSETIEGYRLVFDGFNANCKKQYLDQIERIINAADKHMVGWQYWHYCQCADPTTSGVGPTQALVIDPNKPPTGDNVKADKLKVLARPYPQAVAGTRHLYRINPRGFEAVRGYFDRFWTTTLDNFAALAMSEAATDTGSEGESGAAGEEP